MNQPVLLTQNGLDSLRSELKTLVDSRPDLVARLSLARSMGDLAENSDYISAKEELSFLDGRIAEMEDLISNASVSTPKSSDQIEFGHAVTVKVGANQAVFHIVGEWEANPKEKKISHSSPLGVALMGKKVGDTVEVEAPVGKISYKVVNID